ncbi:response regulator [Paenibacillus hamazuiensis]|uniref:response regulator n=1 Tax=Paenibacillus hamazuiensis TaxID=2936508 RepID=UPI00200DAC2D|nr:response regulator [Paenibacillus hamazuiensis]
MYILLVDDIPLIGRIIRQEIEALDRKLLHALDGIEAKDLLVRHASQIELILLDWNLPEIDGLQFLKMLKSHPSYKNIPVIMLTAEDKRPNVIQAFKAGASDYLVKPFSREDLGQKIMKALNLPRQPQ